MWLCLNRGFFSVVKSSKDADEFLVRSRVKGHLENYFPDETIIITNFNDYPYRIIISKEVFSEWLVNQVNCINYTNFKDSVSDRTLHSFYSEIWYLGVKIFERCRKSRWFQHSNDDFL